MKLLKNNDNVTKWLVGILGGTGFALFVGALLCVIPFLLIWTINTLFGTGLEYFDFGNIIASYLFLLLVR